MFFFFSSRRRHTRYWRDWSSDVCSADLGAGDHAHGGTTDIRRRSRDSGGVGLRLELGLDRNPDSAAAARRGLAPSWSASGWGRGVPLVVPGRIKNTTLPHHDLSFTPSLH